MFPLPRHWRIKRHTDKFDLIGKLVDPHEHVLALPPVYLNIDLPTKHLVRNGVRDNLLWCHGGVVRYYLQGSKLRACLSYPSFTGGVCQPGHRCGRDVYWEPNTIPQYRGR